MFSSWFSVAEDLLALGENVGYTLINNWPVILIALGSLVALSVILSLFK